MNDLFAWYKLLHVKGLGAKSIHLLIRRLKEKGLGVEEVFSLDEEAFGKLFPELGRGHFSRVRYARFHELDVDRLEASWEKMLDKGIRLIPFTAEEYPRVLATRLAEEAPPMLFAKGQMKLLREAGVAIVGSRNVDEETQELTRAVARALAEGGLNVVSGYARGVDTMAHLGALACDGTTTAVLSEGLLRLSVKKEFGEIASWERNTLFLSQFQPTARWAARNAMMRNKVVVGLSKAVVVMASGPERDDKGRMSGTFHAARTARKVGLPVFVLDPARMKCPPKGNTDLLALGARHFPTPENLVEQIKKEPAAKAVSPGQLSLF